MRCFVAAFLPAGVRDAFAALRPKVQYVRWVAPEKYHVTLRFLGELDAEAVPRWRDAAALLDARCPVDCRATAVDGFPNRRRARVVVVRVDSDGVLEELARRLPGSGPRDRDRFRAHVTLGRPRRHAIRLPAPTVVDVPFRLEGVGLYRSVEGRYERLDTRPDGDADLCS